LAGETGRQRHYLGVAIVVSRRSNVRRGGGLIRRPIVQPEADDAILGFGGEVIYIAFETRVMLAQNPGVAAILIKVIGDQQVGAVPGRAVAPLIAPTTGWHDAGQFASGLLFVAEVINPLGIDGGGPEIQQALLGGQVGVTRPAVLFTMGTIGRDALQIAQVRPPARAPDLVQERIRTSEFPRDWHRRVNKDSAQSVEFGPPRKARDLHVLETMIIEACVPSFLAAALQDVGVRLKLLAGIAPEHVDLDIVPIQPAILAEALAVFHHYFVPGGAPHFQLCEPGEVLAHIKDEHARLWLGETNG